MPPLKLLSLAVGIKKEDEKPQALTWRGSAHSHFHPTSWALPNDSVFLPSPSLTLTPQQQAFRVLYLTPYSRGINGRVKLTATEPYLPAGERESISSKSRCPTIASLLSASGAACHALSFPLPHLHSSNFGRVIDSSVPCALLAFWLCFVTPHLYQLAGLQSGGAKL